ncbi:baeRF3 domain-containing protein [Chitinophaga sancti]|uniref:baeRF3 domain-containing protein n=1 Tax=Chitinophaga sancti TaxID=1004 RepID=UPI003F7A5583
MMLSDQLVVMQKNETPPCISIVVALEGAQDKKAALQLVNQSIEEAADHLRTAWPDKAASLVNAFNELLGNYTYSPVHKGIGLYVAPNYNKLFHFSFPVQAKVCLGEKFAVRELLYQEQYGFEYLVLHLEEKKVQLYRGQMDRLQEIKDDNFPLDFDNEYDYTPATGGERVKDKSTIIGLRQQNFYRVADRKLEAYLHGQVLILTGPTKDIGYFEDVSTHKKELTASIHGNFSGVPMKTLEDKVWPAVRSFIELRDQQVIPSFMNGSPLR